MKKKKWLQMCVFKLKHKYEDYGNRHKKRVKKSVAMHDMCDIFLVKK